MNMVNQPNKAKPSLIYIMHQISVNFIAAHMFISIVVVIGFQKMKQAIAHKT